MTHNLNNNQLHILKNMAITLFPIYQNTPQQPLLEKFLLDINIQSNSLNSLKKENSLLINDKDDTFFHCAHLLAHHINVKVISNPDIRNKDTADFFIHNIHCNQDENVLNSKLQKLFDLNQPIFINFKFLEKALPSFLKYISTLSWKDNPNILYSFSSNIDNNYQLNALTLNNISSSYISKINNK